VGILLPRKVLAKRRKASKKVIKRNCCRRLKAGARREPAQTGRGTRFGRQNRRAELKKYCLEGKKKNLLYLTEYDGSFKSTHHWGMTRARRSRFEQRGGTTKARASEGVRR